MKKDVPESPFSFMQFRAWISEESASVDLMTSRNRLGLGESTARFHFVDMLGRKYFAANETVPNVLTIVAPRHRNVDNFGERVELPVEGETVIVFNSSFAKTPSSGLLLLVDNYLSEIRYNKVVALCSWQ